MLTQLVLAVGVSCALTSVLAILMVIAEATIASYGPARITINDDRILEVEGGKSLLTTLKDEQVFIPSACGGRGACGLCKLKVVEGADSFLPTELPWLTEAEKAERIRVSCQLKVKNDMRIVIPEELFRVKQYITEVAELTDLTHDIKQVRLRLSNDAPIDFKPGQFVQIEVPEYELTDEPVYRAYSLASDCRKNREIELHIRLVPEGICTTYVHRHLKVGDSLTVNGPYGEFFLRDTQRDIIFIAGGSGMAPIRAILLEMQNTRCARKARYFFGAKAKRDLFLVEEMQSLANTLPDFQFIPALSAPLSEDKWSGETGLITDVVGRRAENVAAAEAYLCGSPLMIDACITVLRKMGMPEEYIYYDKFA